jgi:hypothetical protein
LVSIFSNFLDDREGSMVVVVKFVGRAVGTQVSSIELDLVY